MKTAGLASMTCCFLIGTIVNSDGQNGPGSMTSDPPSTTQRRHSDTSKSKKLPMTTRAKSRQPILGNSRLLTAYYITFSAQTFIPVTPESIMVKLHKVTLNRQEDRDWLLSTLRHRGTPAVYDPDNLRLVVLRDGSHQRIWVDATGVISDGSTQYRLSGASLDSLDAFLEIRRDKNGAALWRDN